MTDQELRAKNLETVKRYMTMRDAARVDRWTLFAEDGSSGLQYTATGKPSVVEGRENIRASQERTAGIFPEWGFSNLVYYWGEDPSRFLVECDGEGVSLMLGPDRPVRHREHYIHKFILRDGEILVYREFMNPCNELLELGIPVPTPPQATVVKAEPS